MFSSEYNNDLLGFQGRIERKNYIINLLICSAILIGFHFIRFDVLMQYIPYKLLKDSLGICISLFIWVIFISLISVIYRRITDISYYKSSKFKKNIRKFYIICFVVPLIIQCCSLFVGILPLLYFTNILVLCFLPINIISALVLCFIKAKK